MRCLVSIVVMLISLMVSGCHRNPRLNFDASQPHFHIYSKGGWGIDAAYLVLPDDTFHYRAYFAKNGEIERDAQAKIPGLFDSLVKIADGKQAWSMTPAAMAKEAAVANASIQIYDASHEYLSFRNADRYLSGELDGSLGFPASSSHPLADGFISLKQALHEPLERLLEPLAK